MYQPSGRICAVHDKFAVALQVGNVFLGQEFEALQELNLDSNMLVDVSGKQSTITDLHSTGS